MTEQLPVILQSYQNCKINSIESAFATLLNVTYEDVKDMIEGKKEPVFPFVCAESAIRVLVDEISDVYSNFISELTTTVGP